MNLVLQDYSHKHYNILTDEWGFYLYKKITRLFKKIAQSRNLKKKSEKQQQKY